MIEWKQKSKSSYLHMVSRTQSITMLMPLKGKLFSSMGYPRWLRREWICPQWGRPGLYPWVGKISWRRAWQPTPVFLPGESHRQRSLVGYVHGVPKSWTWLKWLRMLTARKPPREISSHWAQLWATQSKSQRCEWRSLQKTPVSSHSSHT